MKTKGKPYQHILFYYPSNKRSVSLETLFFELIKKGYVVSMLTIGGRGDLHDKMETIGIKTYTVPMVHKLRIPYYFYQIQYLSKFCKEKRVDVVFSHLQQANIIAVFAKYLTKSKFVIFRHHDQARNKREAIADFIINRLASEIVVPSSGVKNLMLKNESVLEKKLRLIPYIYNFSEYKPPQSDDVQALRSKYIPQENSQRLLIIMVSRLVPVKRHITAFRAVCKLLQEGYDLTLLILDEGPEKNYLQEYIERNNLHNQIHFVGYTTEVVQYLAAADMLIHPSQSEASNSAIKEAGLLKCAVAACANVGDFSDYLVHNKNGFLMNKEWPEEDLIQAIKEVYLDRSLVDRLGEDLKLTVMQKFSLSEDILCLYEEFLN